MKNYSLNFEDNRFDIDIVSNSHYVKYYELIEDKENLYILVPFQDEKNDVLKIFYPKESYKILVEESSSKLWMEFGLFSLIAVLLSILSAIYTLRPIRSSLRLLEDFIKDIIHDLNTPLTTILINLKMVEEKSDEVESITRSANAISMLHQNLDAYLKESINTKEAFKLKDIIAEQVNFFEPLYNYLQWEVEYDDRIIQSNRQALSRILYNLLSNACKYNTTNGYIKIKVTSDLLTITNDSYGIKNPKEVFNRFYKESDRGLGIGLHIVKKLCEELNIPKALALEGTQVIVSLDLTEVTS